MNLEYSTEGLSLSLSLSHDFGHEEPSRFQAAGSFLVTVVYN